MSVFSDFRVFSDSVVQQISLFLNKNGHPADLANSETCEKTPGSQSLPAAAKWRAAQSPAAPPPTTATRNTIAANSEDIATVYIAACWVQIMYQQFSE